MSFKSIGQVAFRKPLAKLGMEELASRQREIVPSGGILFARNTDRTQKDEARQMVLDIFHPDRWPDNSLHIVTMPGLHWKFERKLLGIREGNWFHKPRPHRTKFTAIENDRAIYFAASAQMPGLHCPQAVVRHIKSEHQFFETAIKTAYSTFFFANVDDLMTQPWKPFDAAWLDFTGPLTKRRLSLISDFYRLRLRGVLVVTALKARWDKETGRAIERAGGHTPWLKQYLTGNVLHDHEYLDTVPMTQFAISKIGFELKG